MKKFEEVNELVKPYLDDVEQHERYPMDPNNFEFIVIRDTEVPIAFSAGPRDGDYVSDYYSCYDWMEKTLKDVPRPNGYNLEIGSAENSHSVYKINQRWSTDENDPIAVDFVEKCIEKLVENGAVLK